MGPEFGRDFLPAHKSFNTSLIVLRGIVSRKYIKVKGLEARVVAQFPICALCVHVLTSGDDSASYDTALT